jgi:hypothetical protein
MNILTIVHAKRWQSQVLFSVILALGLTPGLTLHAQVIGCGQTVAGTISVRGEIDTYTFSGVAGQVVVVNAASADANLCVKVKVYSPTGDLLGTNVCDRATPPITLPITGNYTILVHDSDYTDTGPYGLSLSFVTGQCGTQIDCAQTVTNNILLAGETHTYIFTGVAGQAVVLSTYSPDTSLCVRVEVYSPSGQLLGTNLSDKPTGSIVLPATGTYTVLVHDRSYEGTGAYGLSLSFVTGQCGTQIGCGQTVTGTIDFQGETDTYIFSGGAGQAIVISAFGTYSTNAPYLCAAVDVYDPSGNYIGGMSCNDASTNIVLPATGTYTIRVHDGNYEDTGPYGLSLSFVTGQCGTQIDCGQTITNAIEVPGETDTYVFNGTAGQVVVVDAYGTYSPNAPYLCAAVDVYGPSGSYIGGMNCNGSSSGILLPATGTYTIRVHDGNYQDIGPYGLSLASVTGQCGTQIGCGQTITNAIGMRAETHVYTFNGFAGETVIVNANSPDPDLCVRARVYSATGQLLGTNVCDKPTSIITLQNTGTHTILVHDSNYQDQGVYSVSLLCLGPFPALTITTSNSLPVLTYWGVPGTSNAIEYATNLATGGGQWWPLWSGILTSSPYQVVDLSWTNVPQKFYRAVQLP